MKKIILMVVLSGVPLMSCFAKDAVTEADPQVQEQGQTPPVAVVQEGLSERTECEKAGGKLTTMKECDGSENAWCIISEKERCYADQVKDGKCTVGSFSEDANAIIGLTPRVICDNPPTEK